VAEEKILGPYLSGRGQRICPLDAVSQLTHVTGPRVID
jgi:hypothetical protein